MPDGGAPAPAIDVGQGPDPGTPLVRVLMADDDALVRAALSMVLDAAAGVEVYLSVATAKTYVSRVLTKLEVTNRVQVAPLVHDAGVLA